MPRSVRQEWRDTTFRPHVETVLISGTSAERSVRVQAATRNGSIICTKRDMPLLERLLLMLWTSGRERG